MREKRNLSNDEKTKAIRWWQEQEFLHPMTCIKSKHKKLEPRIKDEILELFCSDCGYTQKNIPSTVYDLYLSRGRFQEIWNIRRRDSSKNQK